MDPSKGKARSCSNNEKIMTEIKLHLHVGLIIINQEKKKTCQYDVTACPRMG